MRTESRFAERLLDLQRDLKCGVAPKLAAPEQIHTEGAGNQDLCMLDATREGHKGAGQDATQTRDPKLSTHSRAANPKLQIIQQNATKRTPLHPCV